jgi:4-amino-4-deoxy-L-arabinose transferase-like glycosyltransferase
MKKEKKILIAILILGALLRLSWLGSIPAGFFRDEAAIGYNIFSILKTGKDEFGIRFPLFFRSFEVFFLPLYFYLSVPLIWLLGLSEFSTRLLSSLSGIAVLYLIYLIVNKIWNKKAALFATFILSISPWHIYYSRGAFEGNLALTLFTAGFYFLLKFLDKPKSKPVWMSLICFVLSMYSYQSERVVVPLLGLSLILLKFKYLWKNSNKIILPAIVSFILLIPLLSFTFRSAGIHRAAGVSIFNKSPQSWVEEIEGSSFVINNKLFLRTRQVTALYTSYFSPRNLFFEGDYDQQRSVERNSVFYLWMLPFLIVGFGKVLSQKKVFSKLILAWILIAPIPASLTGDPFHTYRSLMFYLPLTIIMASGLYELYNKTKNKKVFITIFTLVSIISLSFFLYNYTILTQATRARNWDYGYKQIFEFLSSQDSNKIVIDDPVTESYIHYLFFNKITPDIYQQAVYNLKNPEEYYYLDPSEVRPVNVNNYEFRKVDWPSERGDSGTIFVFYADELPESEFAGDPKVKLLKEIYYPDGKQAYRILKIL